MFDEIILIYKTITKNRFGAEIETNIEIPVQAEPQTIKRDVRDKYNQEHLSRAMRFKFMLLDSQYDVYNITQFKYHGTLFSVKDITKDKTNTHGFIEGVSARGVL
nr:MAG TPA: hypothetical protein [Caudoviricetes sp.]